MKSRITVEIATSCRTSRISEKSAASANDLKNPRYRIVLVNDLLQIGFSPALPSSPISASSFDQNNYNRSAPQSQRKDRPSLRNVRKVLGQWERDWYLEEPNRFRMHDGLPTRGEKDGGLLN